VATGGLLDIVDASWVSGLGCDVDLVRTPGAHLVPGGPSFQGYDAVHLARIDHTVLVYCPEPLRAALEPSSTAWRSKRLHSDEA